MAPQELGSSIGPLLKEVGSSLGRIALLTLLTLLVLGAVFGSLAIGHGWVAAIGILIGLLSPIRAALFRSLLIVVPMLLLGLLSAYRLPQPGKVSLALYEQIQASPRSIDLATLTDFKWDELFIFAPYASQNSVCPPLGLVGRECDAFLPSPVDESQYLLVFRSEGQTIHSEYHPIAHGYFRIALMATRIPRLHSTFEVRAQSPGGSHPLWFLWPVQLWE